MRAMVPLLMTTSFNAVKVSPLKSTCSSLRRETAARPLKMCPRPSASDSFFIAVRNPRVPRLKPATGTCASTAWRAMERKVPSPPRTMIRSAWAATSSRAQNSGLPSSSAAVFSRT